jgi:mannose-6-phosphate isomerase-like protein (cupin superfamily)
MMTSTYPDGDPRAALVSAPAAGGFAARSPGVFDLTVEEPDETYPGGSRSWIVRGQNFWVSVTDLVAGEELEVVDRSDEHFVVVSIGDVSVTDGSGDTVEAPAPSILIVPAGTSRLIARSDGRVVRVFSATDQAGQDRARNAEAYRSSDPNVAPLGPPARAVAAGIRVHRMDEVAKDPHRLGRILRSSSLMVNWFPDEKQPRDPERLSPHFHDDFEQCSITLAGTYMHHLRTTWTPQMSTWREDEHPRVDSPSVTVIPPPLIHTTRAVEGDFFQLLDVFAPPRRDFIEQGWVLNADDYLTEEETS